MVLSVFSLAVKGVPSIDPYAVITTLRTLPQFLLERRQEHVRSFGLGHLRIAGVAPADRLAIADIVLGAGEECSRCRPNRLP
jgi:hypothetical protein